MKNTDVKHKFIELRANGKSFDVISKEINVSKPTLLAWNKQFERDINQMKFEQFQELIEQMAVSKQERVKILFERLRKINDELDQRDYSALSIKDLSILLDRTERQIGNELQTVKLKSNDFDIFDWEKEETIEY